MFRVYYEDRSTYDSEPQDAPGVGVIAIVQPDNHVGRIVLHRWDYYCWHHDEECWYGHDLFGLWDCMTRPGWRKVLFGRTTDTDTYNAIIAEATDDPDFSPRSADHPVRGM